MIDTDLRRRGWFGVLGIGMLTGILLLLFTRVSANPNSTITLVSPNGGEAWAGGQVYSVVWTTRNAHRLLGQWAYLGTDCVSTAQHRQLQLERTRRQ